MAQFPKIRNSKMLLLLISRSFLSSSAHLLSTLHFCQSNTSTLVKILVCDWVNQGIHLPDAEKICSYLCPAFQLHKADENHIAYLTALGKVQLKCQNTRPALHFMQFFKVNISAVVVYDYLRW